MSDRKQKARITRIAVGPEDEPLFSEMFTTVEIVDEAAGEFVEVLQDGGPGIGKIQINPEEWPMLRAAINRLVKQCRDVP